MLVPLPARIYASNECYVLNRARHTFKQSIKKLFLSEEKCEIKMQYNFSRDCTRCQGCDDENEVRTLKYPLCRISVKNKVISSESQSRAGRVLNLFQIQMLTQRDKTRQSRRQDMRTWRVHIYPTLTRVETPFSLVYSICHETALSIKRGLCLESSTPKFPLRYYLRMNLQSL